MIERADWLAQHDTERMQPWRTAGIDRRTWYRRKAWLKALYQKLQLLTLRGGFPNRRNSDSL
jgi:hypothetical protein